MQRGHPLDRQADGADRVFPDVHAPMFGAAAGGDAEAGQGVGDGALELADQRHDLAKPFELDDRIDDDLTRPVIGDVAAALNLADVDAAGREQFARQQHVGGVRFAAQRDDRIVFDDDPGIALAAGGDRRVQGFLQLVHAGVARAPQIEQPNRPRVAHRQTAAGVLGLGLGFSTWMALP